MSCCTRSQILLGSAGVHSAALTLMDTGEAVFWNWAPGELLLHQGLRLPGVLWGR